MSVAGLAQFLGPQAVYIQPEELASEGEVVVYWELVRRLGEGGFLVAVTFGDIPFTPEQEQRSAEFVVESLQLAILVNSEFTHPDPLEDLYVAHLFSLLGLKTVFLWDYEVLPAMGGNVARAIDEKIPELRGAGNIYLKREIPWRSRRVFQHPPSTTTKHDQLSRELGGGREPPEPTRALPRRRR